MKYRKIFIFFVHNTYTIYSMANSFFRFKQFTVSHDLCGMKVGTDGVLLGAYASLTTEKEQPAILDIGTGTGLVALMLAQRYADALIDAVEINPQAALQAEKNCAESPWSDRIQVYNQDIIDFSKTAKQHYDLIVSNPPFFENSLKAACDHRTQARHTDTLSFQALLQSAQALLAPQGRIVLILPANVTQEIAQLAATHGLAMTHILWVRGNDSQPIKRAILSLSFVSSSSVPAPHEQELVIEQARHQYTADYIALTQAFYLKM